MLLMELNAMQEDSLELDALQNYSLAPSFVEGIREEGLSGKMQKVDMSVLQEV